MPAEDLYPVNLRLRGKSCLVVGGGPVAARKVEGLLEAGAEVVVVAPQIAAEIEDLAGAPSTGDGRVRIERRRYEPGEAAAYRLVITATGDRDVNQAVHDDADAAGVWVNAADDPDRCTFTLPARLRRGALLVTVSTGGASPALASWVRDQVGATLGPEYEALAGVLAEARADLQARGVPTEGLDWHGALDSGMLEMIREGDLARAKERLQACLSSSSG